MNEPSNKEAARFTLKSLKELKLPTGVLSLDLNSDASTLFAACIDGGVIDLHALLLGLQPERQCSA